MQRFLPIGIFLFIFLQSCPIWAQDERFFRQIFTGELGKEQAKLRKDYKWVAESPEHKLDLDGDGVAESLKVLKRDGENWLELSGKLGQPFYSVKIEAKGKDSSLFRINLVSLSSTVKVLLLSFYEGFTHYKQFNGTARLFLLSFEDNKLEQISFSTGPSFWLEREKVSDQYFKRLYSIDVNDLNGDKTKEIIVSFNRSNRALAYRGKGQFSMP
ncbi:MAG: hypothetical protein ACOYL6_01480 [Bacteriovoracaceae bacterium]